MRTWKNRDLEREFSSHSNHGTERPGADTGIWLYIRMRRIRSHTVLLLCHSLSTIRDPTKSKFCNRPELNHD